MPICLVGSRYTKAAKKFLSEIRGDRRTQMIGFHIRRSGYSGNLKRFSNGSHFERPQILDMMKKALEAFELSKEGNNGLEVAISM